MPVRSPYLHYIGCWPLRRRVDWSIVAGRGTPAGSARAQAGAHPTQVEVARSGRGHLLVFGAGPRLDLSDALEHFVTLCEHDEARREARRAAHEIALGRRAGAFTHDLRNQLTLECLELRRVLTTIAFIPHQVTDDADGAQSVIAADIDADGDADIVSASSHDDRIAWYENLDGQGSFGPQRTITTDANGAQSVQVADIDGDGDTDILSASFFDNTIAWYENTDGAGSFSGNGAGMRFRVIEIDHGRKESHQNDITRHSFCTSPDTLW